jgi:hypothetical protein
MRHLLLWVAVMTLLLFVGASAYQIVYHDLYVECEGKGSPESACFTDESELKHFIHDAATRGLTSCRVAPFGRCPQRP